MTTVDTVKEFLVQPVTDHVQRLADVTGRPGVVATQQGKLVVDRAVVLRFAYHASVFDDMAVFTTTTTALGLNRHTSYIHYAGDIPDFALHRLAEWRRIQPAYPVTIHSNQPMPVLTWQPQVQIDPVMLGWHSCVHIMHGHGLQSVELTAGDPIYGRCARGHLATATVLAMWDMDKELEFKDG